MRKSVKYGVIAGGVVLGLGLAWGTYLLVLAGELSPIELHGEATCTRIEGIVGGEDIVATQVGAGGLLVSSDDRRATVRGEPVRGSIRFVSLDGPEVHEASPAQPELFHPHGLGLVRGADGHERLFVVNHPRASLFGRNDASDGPAHTIEVFDVVADGDQVRLSYQRTIADPLLVSPNDVAAIDDTRFYVTNDHAATSKLGHKLEEYGHRASGSVLYWDGEGFTRVADGIHYANGIALGDDGETVYVAAVTGGKILIFDRDAQTGALTRREELDARGPDNISVAADGSLWIGGHPKLLTFTAYAKDPDKRSPSMVTRFEPGPNGTWTQSLPFVSDGSDLSGSTVALPIDERRFVIGSVFDGWLLDCRSPG